MSRETLTPEQIDTVGRLRRESGGRRDATQWFLRRLADVGLAVVPVGDDAGAIAEIRALVARRRDEYAALPEQTGGSHARVATGELGVVLREIDRITAAIQEGGSHGE